MQKLSQKWCVVALVENVPESTQFHWKQWPLHVTFAPTFGTDLSGEQLASLLEVIASRHDSVTTKALGELQWSSTRVIELEKTEEIALLHKDIIDELTGHGAVFNEPQYVGENFIPHSTKQQSGSVSTGDKIEIVSLSLVDMFPAGDGARRKIIKTLDL